MKFLTISQAGNILKQGGIIAFPTETVYGLGAVASNEQAVEKIYKAKHRPADNPLICHFYSINQIKTYVKDMPEIVELLFKHFSPGPLSILLNLPENSPLAPATRGSDTVICRIPDHPLALELVKEVGEPLAAPSANTSGKMSGTTAEMVATDLEGKIDGVIDGGPCRIGIESTILDGRNKDSLTILRPGIIGKKELEKFFNKIRQKKMFEELPVVDSVGNNSVNTTPGSKYRHYAPTTPLYAVVQKDQIPKKSNIALIGTTESFLGLEPQSGVHHLSLGSKNNLEEVVRNLYQIFFLLDSLMVSEAYFIVEDWGNSSLAEALKNRLSKVLLTNPI